MASLTGVEIANSYQQLLQIGSNNSGLSTSLQYVQDGSGTNSALQLSNSTVNIDGLFQLHGVTLTATASVLNAVADLTGANGIIAVSAGQVYGRTLVAGGGLSITNATGTEGNPTFSLNTTGVSAGSYGPVLNMEVNGYGQITSVGIPSSVSVATIRSADFVGGTLALSSDASISGTIHAVGAATFDSTVSVAGNLVVTGNLSVNNIKASTVSVTNLYAVDFFTSTFSFTAVSVSSGFIGNFTAVSVSTGVLNAVTANLGSVSVATAINITPTLSATSAVFSGTVNASVVSAGNAVITGVVSANEIDASIGSFNGAVSVGGAINIVGAVSGTSAVFTGVVSVSVLDAVNGDFSGRVSVSALNISGVVSGTSGTFTGTVSVNEIDASIGSFNGAVSVGGAINIVGAVSGTSAVFTGVVSVSTLDAAIGDFSGKVSVGGILNVTGATASISGDLYASTGTFFGSVQTNARVSVGTTLNVTGAVSGTSAVFTGTVSVNEIDASIGSFSGNVSVAGNINVAGSSAPTNGIYVPSANNIGFASNGVLQFRVQGTALAVNYLNVTGVTTSTSYGPYIQSLGSDANVPISMWTKGTGGIQFYTNNTSRQFDITHTATAVNYLSATGAAVGNGPVLSVAGSDSNIDLTLNPKGTGVVQYGTHTATADTAISGYITIKDSAGNTRKLAVIT